MPRVRTEGVAVACAPMTDSEAVVVAEGVVRAPMYNELDVWVRVDAAKAPMAMEVEACSAWG